MQNQNNKKNLPFSRLNIFRMTNHEKLIVSFLQNRLWQFLLQQIGMNIRLDYIRLGWLVVLFLLGLSCDTPPTVFTVSPLSTLQLCLSIQCSTVQLYTVQYSVTLYSAVQCNTIECSAVQHCRVQCSDKPPIFLVCVHSVLTYLAIATLKTAGSGVSLYCTLYTIHCTVHCTLYTVLYTVHSPTLQLYSGTVPL